MSHKAGIAPPLISNKTIIIVLAVCFSLLALMILHSLNGEEQNSKKEEGSRSVKLSEILEDPEIPLYLPEGQQTIKLRTDQWSREIITPGHRTKAVMCRISIRPEEGFYILLKNGQVKEIKANQKTVPDIFYDEPFRLLAKADGQTAAFTVYFR